MLRKVLKCFSKATVSATVLLAKGLSNSVQIKAELQYGLAKSKIIHCGFASEPACMVEVIEVVATV